MFPNSEKFEQHCSEILAERTGLYGDAWKEVGLQGAIIEIHAKWTRLKKLVLAKQDAEEINEEEFRAIQDSLFDLHNYCIIANECLMDGLWFADMDS